MCLNRKERENFKRILSGIKRGKGDIEDLYLAGGSTRIVYSLSERYVLKFQDSYRQENLERFGGNLEEFQFYQDLAEPDRDMFATPLFISKNGIYLIMEKLMFTVEEFEHYSEECDDAMSEDEWFQTYEELSCMAVDCGVHDVHVQNVMINGSGVFKVVDYACLEAWD